MSPRDNEVTVCSGADRVVRCSPFVAVRGLHPTDTAHSSTFVWQCSRCLRAIASSRSLVDSEPHIPRRLPSSIRSRFAAAWTFAGGVFVALCLVMSPVNLPAHSAIAAVAIDDVPGEIDRTAHEATRSRRHALRRDARRVGRLVRQLLRGVTGSRSAWAERAARWTTFSGVPPPRRRGPPRFA